jgi:hypothetical protein
MHLTSGGGGCTDCSREATSERSKKTTEQFIKEAQKIHSYKYIYDKTIYDGVDVGVYIKCPTHGYFLQNPGTHLRGSGCRDCGEGGYKTSERGYLYVLVDGINLTKVGITNKTPEERCRYIARDSNRPFKILKSYVFEDGEIPALVEGCILKELRTSYKCPDYKFSGYTESFEYVNLPALLNRIEELIATQTAAQAA